MSTDQNIVDLADEYMPLANAYDAGWKALVAMNPDDKEAIARSDAEHDRLSDRMDEIEAAVLGMIPTTLSGFAAKAAIGLRVLQTHHPSDGGLDPTFDIIANLCRELAAAAGRAE